VSAKAVTRVRAFLASGRIGVFVLFGVVVAVLFGLLYAFGMWLLYLRHFAPGAAHVGFFELWLLASAGWFVFTSPFVLAMEARAWLKRRKTSAIGDPHA
jgi:hypothetical protein